MEECASREVLKNPSGKARLGKFCKLVDDNMDERPHGWGSPISLQFNSAEAMQVALRRVHTLIARFFPIQQGQSG